MMKKLMLVMMVVLPILSTDSYAKELVYTGLFSSKALGGYDPVAYFTEGKPIKGSNSLEMQYQGANWYFSSENNLNKFKRNPEKYAPQSGGYCAWAVANGDTAEGDPLHWKVYKNKLYLNYNESIQNQWLEKIEEVIVKADANWPGVIQ